LDKSFQQFPFLPLVSIISIFILAGCYGFEEYAFGKNSKILRYLMEDVTKVTSDRR
jgi:hypothetical protein